MLKLGLFAGKTADLIDIGDIMNNIDGQGEIKNTFDSFDNVYVIAVNPERDLGKMTINQWKVLTLFDGNRTVGEVMEAAELDLSEVYEIIVDFRKSMILRRIVNPPGIFTENSAKRYG